MIQSFIEISLTNYCSHGDFDDHHPPTCFFFKSRCGGCESLCPWVRLRVYIHYLRKRFAAAFQRTRNPCSRFWTRAMLTSQNDRENSITSQCVVGGPRGQASIFPTYKYLLTIDPDFVGHPSIFNCPFFPENTILWYGGALWYWDLRIGERFRAPESSKSQTSCGA